MEKTYGEKFTFSRTPMCKIFYGILWITNLYDFRGNLYFADRQFLDISRELIFIDYNNFVDFL